VSRNAYLAGGRDDARAGRGRDAAGDGALLVSPQPPGLPRCRRDRRCSRFSLRHGGAWLVKSRSLLFPRVPSGLRPSPPFPEAELRGKERGPQLEGPDPLNFGPVSMRV
jgi:hypothetical protein